MGRLTRWYNQNKKNIWIVVLTIIAVIVLIQILNNYYKNNTKDESSSTNISTTTYNKNNYSVITEEKIDEDTSNESSNLIDKFFENCNNSKIEDAYALLSNECKNELYPTVNDFKEKYYNRIFTGKKDYDTLLWVTTSEQNTYRVQIMEDLLATGQKEYMPIEDYYTVVNEDGEYKLNISNYITKEDINVSKTQSNIDVNIKSRKIYKEHEIYQIEIKNNTQNKLIFNTKVDTNSMYIQDENELKYIAFLNEIPNSELEISAGMTKTLEIKFNREYKPTIKINKIVFEDMKINNDEHLESIEIEL